MGGWVYRIRLCRIYIYDSNTFLIISTVLLLVHWHNSNNSFALWPHLLWSLLAMLRLLTAVPSRSAACIVSRAFSSTSADNSAHSPLVNVRVHIEATGDDLAFAGRIGESIQSIAARESALQRWLACTCGGNAACSTCHVYVDEEYFDKLDPVGEEELDMLDLAWGYHEGKSRLGCCIKLSEALNGISVTVPKESNNLFWFPQSGVSRVTSNVNYNWAESL